jgi:hypothetical protein
MHFVPTIVRKKTQGIRGRCSGPAATWPQTVSGFSVTPCARGSHAIVLAAKHQCTPVRDACPYEYGSSSPGS